MLWGSQEDLMRDPEALLSILDLCNNSEHHFISI